MKILILHRIPYYKVEYHRGIDHDMHDITYIGTQASLSNIPADLRATKIMRAGTQPVEKEVIDALRIQAVKFDRVISLSEYELLAAAEVRKAYDIVGPRPEAVAKVRNKLLMKACVASAGIRVPHFMNLSDAVQAVHPMLLWTNACVIKPIDGASSENVKIFDSMQQALKKVVSGHSGIAKLDKKLLPLESFEIEEFIDGKILHIDGLVHQGKVILSLSSEYLGNCLAYANGEPLGSIQTQAVDAAWVQTCVSAVGIEEGSFHLEAIETSNELVFLEIANRVGGADVVKTFELATGVHLPSAELALFIDNKINFVVEQSDNKYGWFVFPGHHISSGYCQVTLPPALKNNAHVLELFQLAPSIPCQRHITYQPHEVPLAGVLQAASATMLKAVMTDIFASVKITELKESA